MFRRTVEIGLLSQSRSLRLGALVRAGAIRGVLSVVALSLVFAAPAKPATFGQLNSWASLFAMRQVTIDCPDPKTWSDDELARGLAYVPIGPPMTSFASHAVVSPVVCAGARAVAEGHPTAPRWKMALGVLVVVHEAYHLRLWAHRLDEGRVNCEAIRHFKVAVRLLGGSQELADELLPYALSIYWRLAVEAPAYHWKRCRVPNWRH